MIPRRLIRCVPEHTTDVVETWWTSWTDLHPGWEMVTWRDPIDVAAFPITGHLFPSCVHGAQIAGLVRLEDLWHRGGVYVDSDVEPLRPIDCLLDHPLFICTEDGHHLTDAVIGAEAHHPGLLAALDRVTGMRMADGPQATGPLNTTAVLHDRPDVSILAQRAFYPYSYTEKHRRHERFADTSPESYAVHHWAFSWEDHSAIQTDPAHRG